jgi:hypothetical protein
MRAEIRLILARVSAHEGEGRAMTKGRGTIVLMHVIDAGEGSNGEDIAVFWCEHCGHETEWLKVGSVSEAKRGLPCPKCNSATATERESDHAN